MHYTSRVCRLNLVQTLKNDLEKMKIFTRKIVKFFLFLLKTGRVWAVLTSTHNLCFRAEMRKIMYTHINHSFTI